MHCRGRGLPMNFLDLRTVIFINILTDLVCTAVLAFLWQRNRKRFDGLFLLFLDFIFQTLAVILVTFRGVINESLSTAIPDPLVFIGAFLGYRGLAMFAGVRPRDLPNYIFLGFLTAAHLYFTFARPDLTSRNFVLSLGLFVICFQCMGLMIWRVNRGMRSMTRGTGVVFGIFCLVSLIRIAVIVVSPGEGNDFFLSGHYNAVVLLSYQILILLLTFSLALMVNRRLLRDIRAQEEKFSKAFQSSPYAITLTRLSDGRIMDVNEGFISVTGYARGDVLGKTSLDLRLWADENDRSAFVKSMSDGGAVGQMEFRFRKKSGELLTGIISSDIIMLNGEKWVLTSISDITERKLADDQVRALLAEKELLLKEVHHRIKNNLSSIISLISLQSDLVKDPSAVSALHDASSRVRSMMFLYDKLYRSSNFRELSVRDYLPPLIDEIAAIFLMRKDVKMEKHIDDFVLDVTKLQPLGIIINELITNAIKYAFTGRDRGTIGVSAARRDNRAVFIVEDDGIGMPEYDDPGKSAGFGLQLVGILTRQIKGTMRIERSMGTKIILELDV